ncbi:hypothetical protein [Nostoc sp.]
MRCYWASSTVVCALCDRSTYPLRKWEAIASFKAQSSQLGF